MTGFKSKKAAAQDKLAQPEFIKHHGDDEGWSEWVCPDPDDYLISCCDCGLVHQAQFRVAKYAPAPSEECEIVNDPDLQAQFRMRRSEQWSPEDTAHRAGGMPMAQPEQKPVAWMSDEDVGFKKSEFGATPTVPLYTTPPQRTEQNFCPRCGKRTADLTTIHTCTPPHTQVKDKHE